MVDAHLTAFETLPEFQQGDDLGAAIVDAAAREGYQWRPGCVLVIAQKVVSKCEGAVADLSEVTPSGFAERIGVDQGKDPRLVELILSQSRRIVKKERGVLITQTHHGWICANAGIDRSNVPGADQVTLLPKDSDESARRIRETVRSAVGVDCAVVISDTFGRPWRLGLTNVAIGAAGFAPLVDWTGTRDSQGRPLEGTKTALADELAATAGLLSPKVAGRPVVAVDGLNLEPAEGAAVELQRPAQQDLFR